MGFDAIGVRLAAMGGRVTLAEVEDKTSVELFPTFAAMLEANRIAPPRRNRWGNDIVDALQNRWVHRRQYTREETPEEDLPVKNKTKNSQPIDIQTGSRWKHRKNKRVATVVSGFRPEPSMLLYELDSRRASRDDGDDAYEELAKTARELRQQILYKCIKKTGRHVATCSITVEKFLQTFTPA
jgi:hypothetical protein